MTRLAARLGATMALAAACVLPAIGGAGAARDAQDPQAFGQISGVVRDTETRQPVAGAQVTVAPEGGGAASADKRVYTGGDGTFRVPGLDAGRYFLTASAAGYSTGRFGQERLDDPQQAFDLRAGEDAKGVTLWLTPGGTIAGTVRTASGQPAGRMSVRAIVLGTSDDGRPTLKSALGGQQHTDSGGEYRLANLAPGRYLVEVSDGNEPTSWQQYVTGYVTKLDPSMVFYPDAPSPVAAHPIDVAAGSEVPAIDFVLPASPTPRVGITGRITGAPFDLAGQTLSLVTTDRAADLPPWMELATTTVGSNGAFAFPYVPPGTYEIRGVFPAPGSQPPAWDYAQGRAPLWAPPASQPPAWWCRQELTMHDEAVKELVLRAEAGMRIRGTLALAGDVAGVDPGTIAMTVDSLDGWTLHGRAIWAKSDGTFATLGVPPGHYRVGVLSPDGSIHADAETLLGRDVIATGVEVSSGDVDGLQLTVTRARSTVTGSVQDASGKPRPDARVIWFRVGGAWQQGLFGGGMVNVASTRTDRFGGYDIPGMPGDYDVIAVAGPLPTAWQNTEFLRALSTLATKVTLARGATVRQDLVVRPVPTLR